MIRGETVGMTIPRNYFYIGQEHVFTAEAGIIYPIYSEILMPGDVIKVQNECVVRQQPTISPSYSKFKIKFWDFVVAIRNLDKNIYRFMSGFEEYTSEHAWSEPLPKWQPSDISKTRPGTLWDFLENPVNCIPDQKFCQIDYFRQAYGYIWDMYFRNETRQDSILEKGQPGSWKGEDLLRVNYDRDYFTTALPVQTLGTPMAVPISGMLNAHWDNDIDVKMGKITGNITVNSSNTYDGGAILHGNTLYNANKDFMVTSTKETVRLSHSHTANLNNISGSATVEKEKLNNNTITLENAATVLLRDLTQMLAIEQMNTINAIAGIRDDEFLAAHWGINPSNEALQYPIIFGRSSMNLITETVFQTGVNQDANEGVGEMWGKGSGVGQSGKNTYHAKEFCVYLKLMYIKPETLYGGQGIVRSKTQNTMYDFPFVELNHLAMQPIYGAELLCVSTKKPTSTDNGITITAGADDTTAEGYNNRVLGYVMNYEWYTRKVNKVSGLFVQEQYYDGDGKVKTKENLYNWTEARFFNIEDGKRPIINNDFLQVKLDNRNYQVVDNSIERSQFLVWHNNMVDSWRSMSRDRLPSMLGVTEGMN